MILKEKLWNLDWIGKFRDNLMLEVRIIRKRNLVDPLMIGGGFWWKLIGIDVKWWDAFEWKVKVYKFGKSKKIRMPLMG